MRIRNQGAIIIDELRLAFLKNTFQMLPAKESLLDLGCGEKPFLSIYQSLASTCLGIEVETTAHDQSKVDRFYDGRNVPYENETFDYVVSTEVMEHVPDPKHFLDEINRVLKQDGIAILTLPFMVPLHEQPYDFYRYTPYALRHLSKQSGFEVNSLETFGDYFAVIISFIVAIQLKFWNLFSKKARLPIFSSLFNPFVLLLIYFPQKIYLFSLRFKFFRRTFKSLQYCPKGFGLILKKKRNLDL